MADQQQGFVKKYMPTVALVFSLAAGLASVSNQLGLVINNLVNPPIGSFTLEQATAGGPLFLNFSGGSTNTSLGSIPVPVGTITDPTYINVAGASGGPFDGGSVTFRNGDGKTPDGIYRPFAVITQQGMVYNCPYNQSLTTTSAMSETCTPQQPALAFTLVVLSFVREAMIMGLWGIFVYNKSWLKKKIDMIAKNSIVGMGWYTIALTQEDFRKLQKEKKLCELPKWFKIANTIIDQAGTNIAVAMSSLNVQVYQASGKPLPGSSISMLVLGGIGGVTAIVQAGAAAKKWWDGRKGKAQDVPL